MTLGRVDFLLDFKRATCNKQSSSLHKAANRGKPYMITTIWSCVIFILLNVYELIKTSTTRATICETEIKTLARRKGTTGEGWLVEHPLSENYFTLGMLFLCTGQILLFVYIYSKS